MDTEWRLSAITYVKHRTTFKGLPAKKNGNAALTSHYYETKKKNVSQHITSNRYQKTQRRRIYIIQLQQIGRVSMARTKTYTRCVHTFENIHIQVY